MTFTKARAATLILLLTLPLALLTTPLPAEAQKAGKVYRIGWLESSRARLTFFSAPFVRELRNLGWNPMENFVLDYRSAQEKFDRLPELAAELVRLDVDVIVARDTRAALAAKAATAMIPIVAVAVADPVESGLVASLARPGGNVTGLTNMYPQLAGKQLELLKEIAPGISRIAVLWEPTDPDVAPVFRQAQPAAQALGMTLQSLEVHGPNDLEGALAEVSKEHAQALMVLVSPVMGAYRERIADFALNHLLPTTTNWRWLANAGGLMSYAPRLPPMFERAAHYVDKILRGATPADLPVEQPTTFELIINMKTAKALGLTIPPSVIVRADRVIE